jgi:hypothetical protein
MISFTVAVDYHDVISVTLPRNRRHFSRMIVVTAHHDTATREFCAQFDNVTTFVTDLFYRDGAIFNKWRALQAAIDAFTPAGPTCFLDADILLPPEFGQFQPASGNLYTPVRHMLADPAQFSDSLDWYGLPANGREEFAGYCQIFSADDPVLAARPWFESCYTHAGVADSLFHERWPRRRKVRPPFECLHIGPDGVNWCGRVSPFIDGTVPAGAEQRKALLDSMLKARTGRRDFSAEKLPGQQS